MLGLENLSFPPWSLLMSLVLPQTSENDLSQISFSDPVSLGRDSPIVKHYS
jgi:hypothetical protein